MPTSGLDKPMQSTALPFHWEAFSRLADRLADVAAGSGEAWLVSGLEGAGKTTLLDDALPRLASPARRIVRVSVRHTDHLDLAGFAARVFGCALSRDPPTGDDLDRLTDYLAGPGHGATLLVVDGAHAMRDEVARYIQFAWASAPHLQIVFAARNGFRDLIDRTEFTYLRSRLGPEFAIPRLSDVEAEQYVEHRLRLVGASPERLFADGAMKALIREGQGLPGRINKLEEIGIEIGVMRADRRLTPVSVLQASSHLSRTQRDMTDGPQERVAFGRAAPTGNALMVIPQASDALRPTPVVTETPARPAPARRSLASTLVLLALLIVALGGTAYGVSRWLRPADTAQASLPLAAPAVATTPDPSHEVSAPPVIEPPPVAVALPQTPVTPKPETKQESEPVQAAQNPPTAKAAADEAALEKARAEYFKQAAALGDATAKLHIALPATAGAATP